MNLGRFRLGERSTDARSRLLDRWLPLLCILIISCGYGSRAASTISRRAAEPTSAAKFLFGDSRVHLGIARTYATGDFTSRVHSHPFRQPLYPALLATILVARGDAVSDLARVNLLASLVSIWILYLEGAWCLGSRWLGVVAAASYAADPVLWWSVTQRLLTEPIFVALVSLALCGFLKYLARPKARHLYLATFAAGLAYLARVNGLWLLASIWATLLLNDLAIWAGSRRRRDGRPPSPPLSRVIRRFLVAAAIAAMITIPSWLPRLAIFGDPLHHGWPGNFPWADTMDQARGKEGLPIGPREYFARHGMRDVASRLEYGLRHVFVDAPLKIRPVLYLTGITGFVASLIARQRSYVLLAALALAQMAPLVWIALPNRSPRVPNATMAPFLYTYVAILAGELFRLARNRASGLAIWPGRGPALLR